MGLFRLILALWVVINHGESFFGQKVPQSWAAVQCFFIISGFYMTLILNEKYTGPGSIRLFLTNRFLRLFPAYWAVLLLTVAVTASAWFVWGLELTPLRLWHEHSAVLGRQNIPMLAAANLFIFGQNEIMYLCMDSVTGALNWTANFSNSDPLVWKFLLIPQAWSVELELLFYMLAPFIVRRSMPVVASVIAASFAVRLVIYCVFKLTFDPWTYRFFPNELALFLLGAVAYRIYRAPWCEKVSRSWITPALSGCLFAFTLVFPVIPLPGQIKAWPYFALATVTIPFLFTRTKSWKLDRYVGELSYPIYLCHYVVVNVCLLTLPGPLQYHRSIIAAVLSILLSIVLMHVIINPIERIRQARIRPQDQQKKPQTNSRHEPAQGSVLATPSEIH